MTEENWRDIPGYEGRYQVSNIGNVKSLERTFLMPNGGIAICKERLLTQSLNRNGYQTLNLHKNNKNKFCLVHRLVGLAWLPNPNNFRIMNHIDCNRSNNNVNNIEWCTYNYNSKYCFEMGNSVNAFKEDDVIGSLETLNLNTGIFYLTMKDAYNSLVFPYKYRSFVKRLRSKQFNDTGFVAFNERYVRLK